MATLVGGTAAFANASTNRAAAVERHVVSHTPSEPAGWSAPQTVEPETGPALSVGCARPRRSVLPLTPSTPVLGGTARRGPRQFDRGLPTGGIERIVCRLVPERRLSACLSTIPRTRSVWNGVSWGTPKKIPSTGGPLAVSCTSSLFCVAATGIGDLVLFNGTTWTSTGPTGDLVVGVTCTSSSACTASTESGAVLTYNGATWTIHPPAAGKSFASLPGTLSCPTSGFCADVTASALSTWNGTSWTTVTLGSVDFNSVSCASATSCVAVNYNGQAATWNGVTWSTLRSIDPIAFAPLVSVSCPISSSTCTALDSSGHTVRFNGATWTTPVLALEIGGRLLSVSCPTSTFCAAVDSQGGFVTWNGASWSKPTTIDQKRLFASVSCASPTFCIAFDAVGIRFHVQRLDVVRTDLRARPAPIRIRIVPVYDLLCRCALVRQVRHGVQRLDLGTDVRLAGRAGRPRPFRVRRSGTAWRSRSSA